MWSPNRQQKVESQYYDHLEQQSRAATAPQHRNSSSMSRKKSSQNEPLPPLQARMQEKRNQQEQRQPPAGAVNNSARFLRLKNDAVRNERKARDDEEAILQERVNDHLASLLQAHRQHKRDMMNKWSSHSRNPVPKAPPPNQIERAREEENRKMEQEKEDRRAQARENTRKRLQRGTMLEASVKNNTNNSRSFIDSSLPLNDPNNMSAIQNKFKTLSNSMMMKGGTNNNNHHNHQQDAADARATSNFAQIAQIYEKVLQPQKSERELEDTVTEIPLNFVPNSIRDLKDHDDFGPLLVSLTPDQRKRLRAVDKQHEKARARLAAQEVMFETAKQRRKVATDRIKADPPVDVLVQADLRRYIPADLLETIPELGGGGNTNNNQNTIGINNNNQEKSTVFLTDVDVPQQNQDSASITKKERKEKAEKEKDSTRNEKRRKSLSGVGASASTSMKCDANASTKQRALQGGPLQNPANNRRMTIFAREVLMKVATDQAIREEKEKTRAAREKEERKRKFQDAGLEYDNGSASDDDDDNDDQKDSNNTTDPNIILFKREQRERKNERKRLEELHQHDYDHFFDHLPHHHHQQQQTNNNDNSSSINKNSLVSAEYLKMNPEREQRAAIEWYNKYHAPIISTSTKNKALFGAKKNSSSNATQRQETVVENWKHNHKPVEGLPRPSRTLFFDSEGSKDDLRKSLY